MGKHRTFESGQEAPNNGVYTEVGAQQDSRGIKDPKRIHLHKGDTFPHTSNPKRKWHQEKETHPW